MGGGPIPPPLREPAIPTGEIMSDARITVSPNGSLKVEGEIPLYDHEGNRLATPEGRPYFLCRCGHSTRKPFCDGTHKRAAFDGTITG